MADIYMEPMTDEKLMEWQGALLEFYLGLCAVPEEREDDDPTTRPHMLASAATFDHKEGWKLVKAIFASIEPIIRRQDIMSQLHLLFPFSSQLENEQIDWFLPEKSRVKLWLHHYLTEMRARHFAEAEIDLVSVPANLRTWTFDRTNPEDGEGVPLLMVGVVQEWIRNITEPQNLPDSFETEDVITLFKRCMTSVDGWNLENLRTDKNLIILLFTALEASRQIPEEFNIAFNAFHTYEDYKISELSNWDAVLIPEIREDLQLLFSDEAAIIYDNSLL